VICETGTHYKKKEVFSVIKQHLLKNEVWQPDCHFLHTRCNGSWNQVMAFSVYQM